MLNRIRQKDNRRFSGGRHKRQEMLSDKRRSNRVGLIRMDHTRRVHLAPTGLYATYIDLLGVACCNDDQVNGATGFDRSRSTGNCPLAGEINLTRNN